MTKNNINRIIELDILKAMGMYFIVLGHILPPPDSIFLYVFNVPLFFLISGCLTKRYSNSVFLKKIWQTLVIPCIILFILSLFIDMVLGYIAMERGMEKITKSLLGSQSNLGTLWFVYTLIIVRFLYQYLSNKLSILLSLIFILITIVFQKNLAGYRNACIDVLLAYPVFMAGTYLKKYMKYPITRSWLYCLIILGAFAIIFCGKYNSWVMMFDCSFGKNIILFFFGGIMGSIGLYSLCKLIPIRKYSGLFTVIAEGNILILAMHPFITRFVPDSYHPIVYWLIAGIIILLFIPIIMLIKRFCPYAIGLRKN